MRIPSYRIITAGLPTDHIVRVRGALSGLAIECQDGPCDAIVAMLPTGTRRVDTSAYGDIGKAIVVLLANEQTHEPSSSLFGGSIHVLGRDWGDDHLRAAIRLSSGRSGIRRERSASGTSESITVESDWGVVVTSARTGSACAQPIADATSATIAIGGFMVHISAGDTGCRVATDGSTAPALLLVHRPGALPLVFTAPDTPLRSGDICLVSPGGDPNEIRKTIRAWGANPRRRLAGLAQAAVESCPACVIIESRRG